VRQIYTSPRIENVERVVSLLAAADIATTVTNRRPWAGHDYKGPSYSTRPDPASWPQVWVVRAEDQPRARALLREAGIEPAVRFAEDLARARRAHGERRHGGALGLYLRLALLAGVALLILLHAFGWLG
jgi:hypothetical protein